MLTFSLASAVRCWDFGSEKSTDFLRWWADIPSPEVDGLERGAASLGASPSRSSLANGLTSSGGCDIHTHTHIHTRTCTERESLLTRHNTAHHPHDSQQRMSELVLSPVCVYVCNKPQQESLQDHPHQTSPQNYHCHWKWGDGRRQVRTLTSN